MSFVRTLTTGKCTIFIIFNDIKGAVVRKKFYRGKKLFWDTMDTIVMTLQYLPPLIPSVSATSNWHSKAEESSYKNASHAPTIRRDFS